MIMVMLMGCCDTGGISELESILTLTNNTKGLNLNSEEIYSVDNMWIECKNDHLPMFSSSK